MKKRILLNKLFTLTAITLFCFAEANSTLQCGNTTESNSQGVQSIFENTTSINLKNIANCDSDNIESIVLASRVNKKPLANKDEYIKEGIESGVKVCLNDKNELVIYSYKNKLFNKEIN